MRVFGRNHYLNCDLGEGRIFGYRLRGDPMTEGLAAIATETYEIQKQDSLANEIDAFLDCIATGTKPLVDGRAGCEALRVASMINESIEEHLAKVQDRRRYRPREPAGRSRTHSILGMSVMVGGRFAADDVEHDLGGALAGRGRGRQAP